MKPNDLYLTPSGLFIRVVYRLLSDDELFYARTLEPEPKVFILDHNGETAVMPGNRYAAIEKVTGKQEKLYPQSEK